MEKNNYKFHLVRCVNDVIAHKKLQDPDCYHIILYSRHNKLAKNIVSLCPETGRPNENPFLWSWPTHHIIIMLEINDVALHCIVCILKVVSYYDFKVLSMSVICFQKKFLWRVGGWDELYPV